MTDSLNATRHNVSRRHVAFTGFLVFAILCSLAIPLLVLAEGEDEGEPGGGVTVEIAEPTAFPTDAPPLPTAVPTVPPPPPTAVPTDPPPPPTEVPPTAVPPTATVVPTATAEPTPTPAPEPTPTEVVWVNTDSMTVVAGAGSRAMKPGDRETVTVRYQVTTPRVSTVIHAELTGDTQGWQLSSPVLPDADGSPTAAVWTQQGAVSPRSSFDLPIVVTAPATVTADQTVGLSIWTTASTERGPENGVVKVAQPYAWFTVGAPTPTESPAVPRTMDVAEDADDEPAELDEEGVEEQDAEMSASATPGAEPQATPGTDVGEQGDANSQERGGADVMPVASPAASPVADPDGTEADVVPAASPDASPEVGTPSPTLVCDAGEENIFDCTLDADRDDVSGGALTIDSPSGWTFTVDGAAVEPSGGVDLTQLDVDWTVPVTFEVVATHIDGCVEPGARQSASLEVNLLYKNADTADETASLSLAAPAPGPDQPSLSIQPIDFGTLTWDEGSWGTSEVTGRISVSQDGCGLPESSVLQVEVSEVDPGMRLVITSVSVSGGGIVVVGSNGELTGAPVTIAMIESGFSGDAEVVVTFRLAPSSDIDPGNYQMDIRAKTIAVP